MSLLMLGLLSESRVFRLNPPEGEGCLYSYTKMTGGFKLESLFQLGGKVNIERSV